MKRLINRILCGQNSPVVRSRQSSRHTPCAVRPLTLEPLEDRLVLSTLSPLGARPVPIPRPDPGPIYIVPSAFYTLDNNGVLTVNGDQAAANQDDSFVLDTTSQGGVSVNLNGQVVSFDPAAVIKVVRNTGGGHNAVYVFHGNAGLLGGIEINSGGDDFVQVGAGNYAQQVLCPVILSNPSHHTGLVIDDSADTASQDVALDDRLLLDRTARNYVSFGNCQLSNLTISLGSGGNGMEVAGTPNVSDPATGTRGITYLNTGTGNDNVVVWKTDGDLWINGNAGYDHVQIGSFPNSTGYGDLRDINGAVRVLNTAGATELYVDDGSNGGTFVGNAPVLADGSITGNTPAPITWASYSSASGGVISLNVYCRHALLNGNAITVQNTSDLYHGTNLFTGEGANTVNVLATTGFLNIYTGSYNDYSIVHLDQEVTIGGSTSGSGTLANIKGAIYFTNPAGRTRLTLNDAGDAAQHTAVVTDAEISGLTPVPIYTYGYLKSLTIYDGKAPDTYDLSAVAATVPITLYGGASGADTLLGPNTGGTWSLTGTNAGLFNGFLTFSGIAGLIGGWGSNTFQFLPAGRISGFINGGGGTDTIDYSADGGQAVTVNLATQSATLAGGASYRMRNIGIVIGSTAGTDTLIGANTLNGWAINGPNAGNVLSSIPGLRFGNWITTTVRFSSFKNLIGGTQMDVFKFGALGSLSGSIDGGSRGDWLDYSAFTTPVSVNLANGTATAVNRVRNIQNVIGGSANDTLTGNSLGNILVGGAGNDIITGGSGRNILIGGLGNDTIVGGSADDILIGGQTIFDHNYLALSSILKEWQRTDRTFAARVADLYSGGGYNGTNRLIWGTTVLDDGAANQLTGAGGLDWFFANVSPGHDRITDFGLGKLLNNPHLVKI